MKTIQFIIAVLLFPLSIWYAVGVAVRNVLYSVGIKKSLPTSIPTIGIGNLRMGGTGKTPHTEYLIRLFTHEDAGVPVVGESGVALLSRGYGRKSHGFQLAGNNPSVSVIGDEPSMMARKFPSVTVAVCEKRLDGVDRLAKLPNPPSVVLLDDVFQHRPIKPTVSILLTEYNDVFSDDFILPFGNLREFRRGRGRADIVVVTKCPPALSSRKRSEYRRRLKLQPHQELFFSRIVYGLPQPLFGNCQWQPVRKVLLITGIAHPEPLRHHLEKICTVSHLSFPDHHIFTADDCNLIINRFHSMKEESKAIVTTEKDSIRLLMQAVRNLLSDLPVFFVPIRVSFSEGEKFDQTIYKKLSNFALS